MNVIIIYLWMQGVLVSDVFLMRTTKTWLSNTNFNNSKNWDLGRVPCSQDNVIFPKRMGFVVELPEGVTTLRQLVLPLDGELLLPFNGKLQVVSDTNDKSRDNKCHGKHDITYLPWKVPEWVNPKSWSGHTKATPDIEGIPCHTDNVIFPPESSIRVLMPDTEVRVGSLSIHGQQMETRGWLELMSTDEGRAQFLPKFSYSIPLIDVTSQECNDKTGCACNNEDLIEEVCEVVTKECPKAPCIDPVTPYGNCCPICGAYLLFHYTNDFSMKNLQKYLERKLSGEYIDFHVSKVRGKIQIVLVEKEYDERVQDVIDEIHADVVKRTSLGLVPEREIVAGALISPPSFPRQLFLFFGCLLISTCTVAIIFYIYTDSCNLNTTDGKQYLFAVFENQSEEVELCGSNGTAPQQQPQQQQQQRLYESVKTTKRQAFDNPMYGSTSEVQVKHEDEEEELVEDCPIYSILEDIKLDKEDFEEVAMSEEDSTTS